VSIATSSAPLGGPDRNLGHPTALVTGGAVRVGRAIVERLVRDGYRVWVHYHTSSQSAKELAESSPGGEDGPGVIGVLQADLRIASERTALVRAVLSPTGPGNGRLDLLVNNAASFERGRFHARTDEDFERVLALNVIAPTSLVRQMLPALLPAGSVINILDLGAHHPWPEYAEHCAAKAALWSITRCLATELAPIRVNAISPGTILWPNDGRLAEEGPTRERVVERIPLRKIGTPTHVADTVLFLVRNEHITGQTIVVDGGRLAALAGPHA